VSPEHLELIRQFYEAVNRRDLVALHAMAERYPDWEWRNAPDMPESALRGRDGGLRYMEELFQAFDRVHTEVEDVIDLGAESVILVVRHRVRGAASGAEVERREVHLWRVREGRLSGLEEFTDVAEARAAAGDA
jgi:ketosteroid isomerase-like protein